MRKAAMLLAGLFVLSLIGCGGKQTADRVAREFVGAMKAGQYKKAALLWDYDTDARRENPDWDTFGESQRKLIIDKLAEGRATVLEMWATHFTQDTKIMEVSESGDQAQAIIEGGRVSKIDLIKSGETWRVRSMQ